MIMMLFVVVTVRACLYTYGAGALISMRVNKDILPILFKEPERVRQLMHNGYKMIVVGRNLNMLLNQKRYSAVEAGMSPKMFRTKHKIFIMFVPPVVVGVWGRHVDMYLNDVMNTPKPRYEIEDNNMMWPKLRAEVSSPWSCYIINPKYVMCSRTSVNVTPTIAASMMSNGPTGPYTHYAIVTDRDIDVRKSMFNLTNREAFVSARDTGASILISDDNVYKFKTLTIYT